MVTPSGEFANTHSILGGNNAQIKNVLDSTAPTRQQPAEPEFPLHPPPGCRIAATGFGERDHRRAGRGQFQDSRY